ncbi:aspartate kinase [Candidatus Parcubacteria bacterium]|nr:MAG: aspartate kinase [Candidatus Parcubacteria bacterium]
MTTLEKEQNFLLEQSKRGSLLEKETLSNIYVLKFGGTSLGTAQAIEETIGFINYHHREGRGIVVVVSAVSGITNELVSINEAVKSSNRERAGETFESIVRKHLDIIHGFSINEVGRISLERELESLFCELYSHIIENRSFSTEQEDKTLSFGERLSARIVKAKLRESMRSCVVDSLEIIETDDNFLNASVDNEATKLKAKGKIIPLLKKGVTPVVTGFIGATKEGRPTTLGRNSSDYSATLLGSSLGAREVWICKDPKGIYFSDPKSNPNAELILYISQEELLCHLQRAGDQVLCLKALQPILDTDIVLRVRSVHNYDDLGTTITR